MENFNIIYYAVSQVDNKKILMGKLDFKRLL